MIIIDEDNTTEAVIAEWLTEHNYKYHYTNSLNNILCKNCKSDDLFLRNSEDFICLNCGLASDLHKVKE